MDEAQAVVRTTFDYIDKAGQSLTPRSVWCRPWDALSRESLMPAYINLHAAETSRVLLLSADQLMAALPSIRQRVNAFLPIEDPRRIALSGVPDLTAARPQTLTRVQDEIIRGVSAAWTNAQAALTAPPAESLHRAWPGPSADPVTGRNEAEAAGVTQTVGQTPAVGNGQTAAPALARTGEQPISITKLTDILGRDQQIAAEAMGDACKAEDQQQFQVSRFRRLLLGTSAALFIVVVFMGIVGNIKPGYFPVCLAEQSVKGTMICPTGGHSPSGNDLALILGMGAIGAALAVGTSLAKQKVVVGVRYSLSVAQGLVKVAFGALTAVLGLIILGTQTSDVPGILGTQAGLLTAAVVFGYSQELFTRVIDRQATSLLNAASPSTPPTGQGAAGTPLAGTR